MVLVTKPMFFDMGNHLRPLSEAPDLFDVDSHVTNCDNMFLNYDNSINKIRKMSTNATANCVNDEEEKERASTLSNNFKLPGL